MGVGREVERGRPPRSENTLGLKGRIVNCLNLNLLSTNSAHEYLQIIRNIK